MITLPFPAKVLWPNGRTRNVRWRNAEFQKHKQWAYNATLSALPRCFKWNGEPIKLRYTVTPKGATRRAIDRDNAIAAMKAYQDGIAQAMKVDDSAFAVPEIEFAKPMGIGGIEVAL